MNLKNVLLIGSGRLATHLQFWSSVNSENDKNLTLKSWDRHQDPKLLQHLIEWSDIVWLAISDSALPNFFDLNLAGHQKIVVHFSGSYFDSRMICAHPLMSFPLDIFDDESVYQQVYFGIQGCEQLSDVLPGFKNPFFKISQDQKGLYHSLCVISGNFPVLLWNQVLENTKKLNIPEAAFQIYISQVVENFKKDYVSALTGPFQRKDYSTIEKNLMALEKNDQKLFSVYKNFKSEFLK